MAAVGRVLPVAIRQRPASKRRSTLRFERSLLAAKLTFTVNAMSIEQASLPALFWLRCAQRCLKTAEALRLRSSHVDESKLLQRGHAVVQPDLFNNLAVFEP
jgi:hypothetical protein